MSDIMHASAVAAYAAGMRVMECPRCHGFEFQDPQDPGLCGPCWMTVFRMPVGDPKAEPWRKGGGA